MHYGVRCACLHMRNSLGSLPGLAPACKDSADVLSAALHRVDAGQCPDHPKQAALKRVLSSMSTLQPVLLHLFQPQRTHVLDPSCMQGTLHPVRDACTANPVAALETAGSSPVLLLKLPAGQQKALQLCFQGCALCVSQ